MRRTILSSLAAVAVIFGTFVALPAQAHAAPYFNFSVGVPGAYGAYYSGYAPYAYPPIGPQMYVGAGGPWGPGGCGYGYGGYPAGAYYRGYYGRPAYPGFYAHGHGHHHW